MSSYMAKVDAVIATGDVEKIQAEHDRQTKILETQLQKRYSGSTPPKSRFAVAAHITKTEFKLWRLEHALRERGAS